MITRHRFFKNLIAILLSIILICSMLEVVFAGELTTLGVYFFGLVQKEDGSSERVKLEGKFRIVQNGTEIGTVQAGEESVLLTSAGTVTIQPILQTMPSGWQIPEEGMTFEPRTGGTVTVPFAVQASEDSTEITTEMPAFVDAETQEQEEPEDENELTETPEETDDAAGQVADEQQNGKITNTRPVILKRDQVNTPTPVPAATPVPVTPAPAGDAVASSLLVQVFDDPNNNGEMSIYEYGVAGIPVEIITEDGSVAAYALTDGEGLARIDALAPGTYMIRVTAPDGWGFTKKGKTSEITSNFMEQTIETVQTSKKIKLNALETKEYGVGIWELLHVSGFCWLETDADGIRKSDESMLDGVRIVLEGQKNNLTYETYSDAEGNWYIGQVKPGFYKMTVYVPDGMMFTKYSRVGGDNRSIFTMDGAKTGTKVMDMNDGKSVEQQNVGFMVSSFIEGRCFLDENYNGVWDEGEKPLPGVKLQAIKQIQNDVVAETVSGEDGTYSLSGLRANTYVIRAILPEGGATFTKTVATAEGNRFKVRSGLRESSLENQLIANAEVTQINVGAIYFGSVSGTVYVDQDFSGDMNGKETPEAGLGVTLLDGNGTVVAKTRTNTKGQYLFEKLTPGQYRITMAAIQGYAFTKPGDGNVMLNTTGGNGETEIFTLPLGADMNTMNIGMIIPGTVTGSVFADANDNGIRDNDENGLEGMKVELVEDETIVFTTTVNRNGEFKFDAVMPGEYKLHYVLPEYGIFAKVDADGNQFAGEGYADTEPFFIASAGSYTAPLCGALTLGRISGQVFRDSNGNGVMDAGESPMSNAVITLTPGRDDLAALTVTTGEDGAFELTDLHPDTYRLTAVFPDGYVMSRTDHVDLPIHAGSNAEDAELPLCMGESFESQILGCVRPAGLQGRMWLDENNNGLFDDGEQTPAGQKVTVLDETNGEVFAELLTDDHGYFGTHGMIPGKFTVYYDMDEASDETKPGDCTFGRQGNRLITSGIQLGEDETRADLVLGIVRFTSISGQVWLDQVGEILPLEGANVSLLDAEHNEVSSMLTESDGTYCFTGLMPGQWFIRAELPEGCLLVEPEDERLENGLTSIVRECDGHEGMTAAIDLKMGHDLNDMDIGSVMAGKLGDFCWVDLNENGWQDGDEPGVPGVRVVLCRNGEPIAETVSNEYGYYWFTEVYPATYDLEVHMPAEIIPTVRKNDIPLLCSVLEEGNAETAMAYGVVVRSNESNYNADLGFVIRPGKGMPAGLWEGRTQNWQKVQ